MCHENETKKRKMNQRKERMEIKIEQQRMERDDSTTKLIGRRNDTIDRDLDSLKRDTCTVKAIWRQMLSFSHLAQENVVL